MTQGGWIILILLLIMLLSKGKIYVEGFENSNNSSKEKCTREMWLENKCLVDDKDKKDDEDKEEDDEDKKDDKENEDKKEDDCNYRKKYNSGGKMCNQKWGEPICNKWDKIEKVKNFESSPNIKVLKGYYSNDFMYELDYEDYDNEPMTEEKSDDKKEDGKKKRMKKKIFQEEFILVFSHKYNL